MLKLRSFREAFVIFLFLTINAVPQVIYKNSIGVNFGLSYFHERDDHASPLFFRSIGISPSINYQFNGDDNSHFLEATYFTDNLTANNSNFHINNKRIKLKYSFLHKIKSFNLLSYESKFLIGFSLSSFNNISDYRFAGENLAIKSWYCNHSINVDFMLNINFSNNKSLSFQFNLPLVSNISRPNYSPSLDYNYKTNNFKMKLFGSTVFFPKNSFLQFNICYQTPLSDNINFSLKYDFFYANYNLPKTTAMYMNNIYAGAAVCF